MRTINNMIAETYFNSIKVQLEQYPESDIMLLDLFQFHKGTIRTTESVIINGEYLLFQFHKGTIRTRVR